MTQYNKILTTVNSVTSNYNFTPDLSNLIVIDTSNNRIGINKVNPEYSIDVSSGLSDPSGTIRCGTLRVDQIIGRTANMEDLYLGPNTLYIDGIPALGRDENKKLIIGDVSGRSTLSSVDIDGSLNINGNLDISNGSIFLNGFKTITKFASDNKILIENNGGIDISGTVSFLNVPSFSGGQPVQNDADIAGGYIYNTPIGYTGTQIVPDDGYFVTTQTHDVKVKNRITFSDNLATSFGSPLLSANFDSVDVSNHLTVRNGDASFNNAVKIGGHLILHGQLHGPSTFIIDPKPIDNSAGTVQIKGDLEVLGNQTTIHSTIVDICDNRIRLNALYDIDAGIDISINNTTKSFIYESNENTWKIDDASLNVNGSLGFNHIYGNSGEILKSQGSGNIPIWSPSPINDYLFCQSFDDRSFPNTEFTVNNWNYYYDDNNQSRNNIYLSTTDNSSSFNFTNTGVYLVSVTLYIYAHEASNFKIMLYGDDTVYARSYDGDANISQAGDLQLSLSSFPLQITETNKTENFKFKLKRTLGTHNLTQLRGVQQSKPFLSIIRVI